MSTPTWQVHLGDCVAWLQSLPECSVDAIVCDPPYGIGMMSCEWDALPPGIEWARACLRVLKPGGHLVAFGATRVIHRLSCAVEDGGFQLREQLGWVFFNGFPKSLDVSKAIDAAAGAVRERCLVPTRAGNAPRLGLGLQGVSYGDAHGGFTDRSAPTTPEAQQWSGWGTATKPAYEPALLARRPLDGTVAANVLRHGTGALNIDACRFAHGDPAWVGPQDNADTVRPGNQFRGHIYGEGTEGFGGGHPQGRWPANLYHCPKANRGERERGCDGLPIRVGAEVVGRDEDSAGIRNPRAGTGRTSAVIRNHHIAVKPVALMRWLCRLVTPPGGLVVDPFTGSGSTGVAAVLEGFRFAGAEMEPDYHAIASARIAHAVEHPEEWDSKRKPKRPKAKPETKPTPAPEAEVFQLSMFARGGR